MPTALPSGFVDSGETATATYAASVRLELNGAGSSNAVNFMGWSILPEIYTTTDFPLVYYWGRLRLVRSDTILVQDIPLGYQNFSDPEDGEFLTAWSPWIDCTASITPLRAGARLNTVDGHADDAPQFARWQELEYALFADEDTDVAWQIGSYSLTEDYGPAFGGPLPGPAVFGEQLAVSVTDNGATGRVEVQGLQVNEATVDTTGLSSGPLIGDGGGHALTDGTGGNGSLLASLPYEVREVVETTVGGITTLPADVIDGDDLPFTTPLDRTRTWMEVSWTGPAEYAPVRSFRLDASWAAAQSPPVDASDPTILCRLRGRGAVYEPFNPVTLTVAAALPLEMGTGAPSAFVSSDTDKLAVADGTGEVVLTVTETGAHVTRNLASAWRTRYQDVEAYENTKRAGGEDYFWWGLYGKCRLTVDAPVAGDLILTLAGVHFVVDTDGHETGSTRQDNYEFHEEAWGPYEYTISVEAGANEVTFDLLFPDSGAGPVFITWVDTVTLAGFAVGEYTLTGLGPVASLANLKVDFGKGIQREDYSAGTIRVDGGGPLLYHGDQAFKDREVGPTGGWFRYVAPLIGAVSGIIQDAQWTLQEWWERWGLLEGVTVSWDAGAFETATEDAQGNNFGPLYAQCSLPSIPGQALTPGTPYAPPCALVVWRVRTCAGIVLVCRFMQALYGAIEVLVKTDQGERAGAGVEVTGSDGFTGTTGADGMVYLEAKANDDADLTAGVT